MYESKKYCPGGGPKALFVCRGWEDIRSFRNFVNPEKEGQKSLEKYKGWGWIARAR